MGVVVVEMLSFVLLLAMLGEAVWGALSAFLFGGAKRNAVLLLAFGIFNVVVGTFFLAPLESSRYAIQDNAYLGNLILGVWMMALGSVFMSVSLAGLGYRWWGALIAVLIGLPSLFYAISLAQTSVSAAAGSGQIEYNGITTSAYGGAPLLIWLGGFAALITLAVIAQRQWVALSMSWLVGAVGAAIVLVIYGYGRMNIAVVGIVGTEADLHKPPYVDLPQTAASVIVGALILALTFWWGKRQVASPPAPQALRAAA